MIEYLVPSLILPTGYNNPAVVPAITLASTETVNTNAEHTSEEVFIPHYGMKTVHVLATEIVPVAGAAGALNIWVEYSNWPTANSLEWPVGLPVSALYWAAIGGGGGALPPTAPVIEPGVGINLTPHTIVFGFQMHTPWARVVVQTPAPHATSYWLVQVFISMKGQA